MSEESPLQTDTKFEHELDFLAQTETHQLSKGHLFPEISSANRRDEEEEEKKEGEGTKIKQINK